MKNTRPRILTYKLLISNIIDNRGVIGIYDSKQHALRAKSYWESCFTASTFEIVENK